MIGKKIAKRCISNAIMSDRVTANSNFRAYLYQAFALLGDVFPLTKHPSAELPQWSEYEVAVADVICWLVAFLARLNCASIDRLIRDVVAYRSRHPLKKPRRSTD